VVSIKQEHSNCDSGGPEVSHTASGLGDVRGPDYQAAGKIGESLGLIWYGNPKARFREAAHFQNPNWAKPKVNV